MGPAGSSGLCPQEGLVLQRAVGTDSPFEIPGCGNVRHAGQLGRL